MAASLPRLKPASHPLLPAAGLPPAALPRDMAVEAAAGGAGYAVEHDEVVDLTGGSAVGWAPAPLLAQARPRRHGKAMGARVMCWDVVLTEESEE